MTNKRPLGTADGARRAAILDAAKRLFAERGYHATSMRDIAAAVDLLGGSLYAHITGKEDLLWVLVHRAADEFLRAAATIEREEPDPRRRLARLVEAHVAIIAADPAAAAVFHHEWRALSPERRARVAGMRRTYEAVFRRAVDDGIHTGIFQAYDPKFATLLPLSLANWLSQWYRPGGRLTPPEIAREFNALIERALGVCPQAPGAGEART